MTERPLHILFLCTGNSARSILAEALTNHLGKGRVVGYSAGSFPKDQPNPMALELLKSEGIEIKGLRSKSWDEFTGPKAPPLDIVITVCDQAAGETCPFFLGGPIKAHWGIPDPPAANDVEKQRIAFRRAYDTLKARISDLVALLVEKPEPAILKKQLQIIAEEYP